MVVSEAGLPVEAIVSSGRSINTTDVIINRSTLILFIIQPAFSINVKFNYFRHPACYIFGMITNPDFLIVYGTLRPPFDNQFALYLRNRSRCVGEGTFVGRVFNMGSYPGAIYQQSVDTRVCGTVYDIGNQKETTLTYLDYYEGVGDDFEQPTEFIRAIIPVQVNNQTAECWVYLYNLSTDGKPIIESGDFALHMGSLY